MNSNQPNRRTPPSKWIITGRKRISAVSVQSQSSTSHRLLAGFIAVNLIAISIFSLPVELFPFTALRGLLAPYMCCVGLNEMWNTFAPNPKSAEQYLKAVVVTLHGDTEVYSFPRMEELSFFEMFL
jgi:hypothetical protein